MAILDILKKRKPKKKVVEDGLLPVLPVKKPRGPKTEKRTTISSLKSKRVSEIAYRVLKGAHVTEKATDLTKNNQYIFKIFPRANKIEVKKVVEDIYGVDVAGVNIVNIPAKKRRLGRIEGRRKGYKKAIIKIKEGQKIEVLPR